MPKTLAKLTPNGMKRLLRKRTRQLKKAQPELGVKVLHEKNGFLLLSTKLRK